MKRRAIAVGTSALVFGMIISGLAVSVSWFLTSDNSFNANVSGSVVEEYFHCGSGTALDPFVITRPMHYYHLVEFFQRKTELPISGGDSVTFGTDYLYFQVGYDLDEDDTNGLEVYAYDNDGTYMDEVGISKTLNMAYFSGDNALMPIGTSECPFFGSFDGGGDEDSTKSITVENLHIKSMEEVIVEGDSEKSWRYTSDVGMFGYVADSGDGGNTSIQNLFVNGLTIDLTGAAANKNPVSGVSHTSTHTDQIYVGYIVGHLHTYTNYDSSGPTNASPIHDVYVNNAKVLGGAPGAKSSFGYVGYADTIDGKAGTTYDLATKIAALEAAAGGGDGNDWGASLRMDEYLAWCYNNFEHGGSMSANITNNNVLLSKTITDPETSLEEYKITSTVLFNSVWCEPTGQYKYRFVTAANTGSGKTPNMNYVNLSADPAKGGYIRIGSNYYEVERWEANNSAPIAHSLFDVKAFTLVMKDAYRYSSNSYSTVYLNKYDGNSNKRFALYSSATSSGDTNRIINSLGDPVYPTYRSDESDTGYTRPIYRMRDGSYLPLKFKDISSPTSVVGSKNTGYLVGKSNSTANGSPKLGSYNISMLSKSINAGSTSTFSDGNCEIITYDSAHSWGWVRIKDSHNGSSTNTNLDSVVGTTKTPSELDFKKYEPYTKGDIKITETASEPLARTSLKNMLSGASRINGIHFDGGAISNSSPTTIPYAHINGATSSIAMPKGSLDFHLKKKGYINFFAGAYTTTADANMNFFSLYKVDRSSGLALKEIYKIYDNTDSEGDADEYYYEYNANGTDHSSGTKGETCLFDVNACLRINATGSTSTSSNYVKSKNALYYFEIPVNSGEYAMGMVSAGASTVQGAYMIYLDIGTSGTTTDPTTDQEQKIAEEPIFTQIEYLSTGFVTNSCFNIGYVLPASSTKSNFSVTVSRAGDVFNVVVTNTTGSDVTIYVLLVDDDDDNNNDYPYTYTLKYNTGAVSAAYNYSAVWTGASGGTALAPPSP